MKNKNECTCNQHTEYKACCSLLHGFVNNCKTGIKYHPAEREITILLARGMGRQLIYYCPWCATKLPESLLDDRLDILEKEYNIDDPFGKQKKNIPAEFLTDEWWVKRKL